MPRGVLGQVKRKPLPEESITVEGGPMPQVDPRQMYPVPPQIQPTQTPVSNDAMLLERVKQLRGGMQAPQPDAMRPSQVMYPMDRSAGMQADQMQAQIGVKPDPFAGMSGWKRMLAQGMLGAAEGSIHAQDPGGYNGWRQRQDQIEQQATNSQLEHVRSLRNEQLQREQMYQTEQNAQIGRERQQVIDELNQRNIESQIAERNQPQAGMGAMGTYIQKGGTGSPPVGTVVEPAPMDELGGLPKSVEALEMVSWLHKNPGKTPADWYDYKQKQGGEPLYPVVRNGSIVYAPRSQAAGQAAPRTTFDITGMPTTAGQQGISMIPPPAVPDITQSNLSGWKLAIDTLDRDIMPKLKGVESTLGPFVGRVKLAEIEKMGGMGATPDQIKMAINMRRLLMSQAFAEGGKQLTPTEKVEFIALNPALTDTIQQAVIKAQQARDYLQRRYQARLEVMPVRERGQVPTVPGAPTNPTERRVVPFENLKP